VNLEDLLESALAQIAALTAELAAARLGAAEERGQLQARIDELLARVDELVARVDELVAGKRKKPSPAKEPSGAGNPAPSEATPPASGDPPTGPPAPDAPPPPAPPPAPTPSAGAPATPLPDLGARPIPPVRPEKPAMKEKIGSRNGRCNKPKPNVSTIIDPPVRPDKCAHCGGDRLTNKDTQKTVLVDYVRGYVRRREVGRIRCRCNDCARLTTAPAPLAFQPGSHFTAPFVAFILYSKIMMHLPWERVCTDLQQQGYPIASSTLNTVVQRALETLAIVAKVLWAQFISGPYGQSDATGISVVTPGKKRVHHGQMFVFCWDKLVVFRYQPDKAGETFKQMLVGFQGSLVLDASSTHNDALDVPGVFWSGCNAHGLRKFEEATEADPELGPEGARWITAMFDQERAGRDQGLAGEALLAWRQTHIAPITRGFKSWLAIVHPHTVAKTPLREATDYYVNYWRPMTRFLRDPNLPLENNFSERNLRAIAVGRSNWTYAGNAQAARNLAVGYTLVQTAKAEGVDVLNYLTWALPRVAACNEDLQLAAAFTPAAYKAALQRTLRPPPADEEAQKARDR
jgi:transposase